MPSGCGADNGHRAVAIGCQQTRAFNRVDCDVEFRASCAEALTSSQHRSFVLLTLTDDDRCVDRGVHEQISHRIDGGLICGFLFARAHVGHGGGGGGGGHPGQHPGNWVGH